MLQALSNYNKRRHTTAQTTRRPLCRTVCVSIWSDMLEGENKCKSHIAQSLSEYSIKHIFKSRQNRKVITLQAFQLSQSNFCASRPQKGKAGHPSLRCCNLLLIHPESINPNPPADRGCPRRYLLGPLKMPAIKERWIYQVSWQPAKDSAHRSPREQLCLMSRYVLHEQLFWDGFWD